MFFLRWYRFYSAVLAGAILYFGVLNTWWSWLSGAILFRFAWFLVEKRIHSARILSWYKQHSYTFKQQYGPYGIRLINKAEKDPALRQSLADVFTPNLKKLKETVDQLEMMDNLFQAGMRPDGDTWQLHDLKLKYGKYRLEKEC